MTRYLRYLPLAIVAGITAYASYLHGYHVALRYGELREIARLLPISVDGMMIVASIAMVDDRRAGRSIRPWAKIGFLTGVAASGSANLAAAQPTIGGLFVTGWPALALLIVVQITERRGRPIEEPPPIPTPVQTAPAQAPSVATGALKPLNGTRVARVNGTVSDEALRVKVAAARREDPLKSIEAMATLFGVGKKRITVALEGVSA